MEKIQARSPDEVGTRIEVPQRQRKEYAASPSLNSIGGKESNNEQPTYSLMASVTFFDELTRPLGITPPLLCEDRTPPDGGKMW